MSENIDLRNIVADIATAYFRKSHVTPSEIQTVISHIATSLSAVAAPAAEPSPEPPGPPKPSPAQIRKSITRNALISFEDNRPYKTLRRHLAARGLSPEDYRSKWGLPEDYPMAAPSYRAARASLARAHGFGGRGAPTKQGVRAEPSEPAANAAAPAPQSTAAPQEPAAGAAPAAAPGKQGVRAPGLSRKSVATPAAFRPRDSVRDPETGARHKRWLAMLSETDWARIRAFARQVNHAHAPAALTNLSAPLRVRVCLAGHEARFPGEHVGTLRGGQVAVLISEPGERRG